MTTYYVTPIGTATMAEAVNPATPTDIMTALGALSASAPTPLAAGDVVEVQAGTYTLTSSISVTSGGGEIPDAPTLSVIDTGSGTVTATVIGTGTIRLYYRLAGTNTWTAGNSRSGSGIISQYLIAGYLYEFAAIAIDEGQFSPWSSIIKVFVTSANLCFLTQIENWAVGILASLSLFKTVRAVQPSDYSLASLEGLAPMALVKATLGAPTREGGYECNRQIALQIVFGSHHATPGLARRGSDTVVGVSTMAELIFDAFDCVHPGAGFDCDEFYFVGAVETFDTIKEYALEFQFQANWLRNH
ncbi:hypothetical protein ACQ9LF_06295 [Anaerohalosphaeraceae bacterium U12dextr]|jgi:hypothetical protein